MKNGYTLIELLAVVVIITLIVSITMFMSLNMIKDTNEKLDSSTLNILYEASLTYLNDNIVLESNGDYIVTIRQMNEADLISKTFIETNNKIQENSCVKVNITNGIINYEFSYEC